MKDEMRKHGVDVRDVRVVDGVSSGVAVIVVDDTTGDNRIKITPGVNPSVLPDHAPEVEILIVSESEAALLTGVDFTVLEGKLERQEALKLKAKEADHEPGDRGWFGAHRIENAVENRGAGDTCVGAIAVNFVELKHPEGRFYIEGGVSIATDAAAWSVQRPSTLQSMP
ncbi:hypothetical protein FRB90_007020 [Tulasnella sp. 427]|nr:hypothetical protein FRB90_007020 [Tulasnella sp. 427]